MESIKFGSYQYILWSLMFLLHLLELMGDKWTTIVGARTWNDDHVEVSSCLATRLTWTNLSVLFTRNQYWGLDYLVSVILDLSVIISCFLDLGSFSVMYLWLKIHLLVVDHTWWTCLSASRQPVWWWDNKCRLGWDM